MADKRYTAIFDARDQMSDKLKRIEQATNRARDANGRFIKATEQVERAQDKMRSSTNQAVSSMERMRRVATTAGNGFSTFGRNGMNAVKTVSGAVGGLVSSLMSLPALIAGAGAAFGAWKLGDAVVGGALRQEMTLTQLQGLSGSEDVGNSIYAMLREQAQNSTFSTQDYTQATRSYLGFSKDESQLSDMLDITKRLALLDPIQGFDGASFALKEAMSGDIMSLSERFELPKSFLRDNGFDSGGDYLTNLSAVEKTLEQMGMGEEAVAKFESTGMAQLTEFKNKSLDFLGQWGRQSVDEMKPFFERVNNFFGSPSANKFAEDMSVKVGGLFDRLTTDLSTISWSDIENGLTNTFSLLGSIGETGLVFMDSMSGSKGGTPADIMRNFGDSIGTAAEKISAFNDDLRSMFNWIDDSSFLNGTKDFLTGNPDENGRSKGAVWWAYDGLTKGDWSWHQQPDGSHMGGLSYVPTDGYKANLHKGERVLTASENRDYAQGTGGQVLITGNTFHVRKESDVDAVASAIVQKLQLKG